MSFEEKKFTIDGEPCNARFLIDTATKLDEDFKNDWCRSTSQAAQILRKNGYIIDYNKRKSIKGEIE